MFECEKCKETRILQTAGRMYYEDGCKLYERSLRCIRCGHRFTVIDLIYKVAATTEDNK